MAWFVTYSISYSDKLIPDSLIRDKINKDIANIILKDIHPVIWAAKNTRESGDYHNSRHVYYIHFFHEIPDEVADSCEQYSWCDSHYEKVRK